MNADVAAVGGFRRPAHLVVPAALVAILLGPASATDAQPNALDATRAVTATADAFVSSARPAANFGDRDRLEARRSSAGVVRSYIRFDLGRVAAPISAARLEVFVLRASDHPFAVAAASSRWSERRITYGRAPHPRFVLGRSGPAPAGSWVAIDVTASVLTRRTVSFVLLEPSATALRVSSREGADAPRLVFQTTTVGDGAPYPIRGVFERDGSPTGFDDEAAVGFDVIDSGPYDDQLDELASTGLHGFVWLGGYDNDTCAFRETDAWVRRHVRAIAGHPAIAYYLIDDEPHVAECPSAPRQIGERSRLVRALDPGAPTLVDHYRPEEFAALLGRADVLGIVAYPCSWQDGCVLSKIDHKVAAAEAAGWRRYLGIVQAHGDSWYRQPTPSELHDIFARWRATAMQGYLVFSWEWPPDDPSLWLANHPELLDQLRIENAS